MAAVNYRVPFGASNAGGSPVFGSFRRADNGAPITPPPTFYELGGGWYGFDYDWSAAPAGCTAILYGATVSGVEMDGQISSTDAGGTTTGTYVPPTPGSPLPGQVTLASLRLLAQQRADMVNSNFVTPAEWTSYINGSYGELYDLLIEKYGEEYFGGSLFQFTTDGASEFYPLPDGTGTYLQPDGVSAAPPFYKMLGVDLKWPASPGGWLTVRRFNRGERNAISYMGANQGIPDGGTTIRVHYAPRLTPLVNDADLIDGVSGWEELVVVDAARKALLKEESDTSGLEREKAALLARIEAAAAERDPGEPPSVVDVNREPYGPMIRYRLNGNKLWLRKFGLMAGPWPYGMVY